MGNDFPLIDDEFDAIEDYQDEIDAEILERIEMQLANGNT
jgi:hypothetical protein